MDSIMKARPILFNAPMVNAILAGNKTQTRRLVKPQPYIDASGNFCWNGWNFGQSASGVPCSHTLASPIPSSETNRVYCPLGKVGDRLWVRETWNKTRIFQAPDAGEVVVYAACDNRTDYGGPWKPSIHMPRRASRITLEITAVRVERLQDISEQDARGEGCEASGWMPSYSNPDNAGFDESLSAADNFCGLWESIYGTESWATNPWVWVIEFKRITP